MFRKITVFIRRKFRNQFKEILSKKDIESLKDKNFVIISDNCWGGTLYQWYKREYNSPFVGLFFYAPCYIKLLSNLDHYLKQDLSFIEKSKYNYREKTYPIALLDDVEVHFSHYKTETEAKDKWNRRKVRILAETNLENYFFEMSDAYLANKEYFIAFHHLPFKNKLSFSVKDFPELKDKNHIKIYESCKKDKNKVPNGKKLFKLTFLYFDINKWLLGKI